jgi:outer membrane lipoprotein-sorting protein
VGDLSRLLVLLDGAEEPFASIRVRFRVWRQRERALAAFVAQAKRDGATVSAMRAGDAPPSSESVEFVSVWRAEPDRMRVEYEGGDHDGTFGVRDGEHWWTFDPRSGAMTNAGNTSIGSGTGTEFETLLMPAGLLGLLRFAPTAPSMRAGRAVIVADARPRPERRRGRRPRSFELHELGAGADRYRLEVDAERGIVLAAHAFAGNEPFQVIEATEVEFDAALDDGLFVFVAPEGEEIRAAGAQTRELLRHASISEAQAAAPFTVLVPERVPSTWTVHCTYTGPSERPPSPPSVSIQYRSQSGHESLSLVLQPTGQARYPGDTTNWEQVQAGPYTARVSGRGERGPQSQLRLDHDGTSVLMLSDTLSRDQLVAVAAILAPAPEASPL